MTAFSMLEEFLVNTKPDTLTIPYVVIQDLTPAEQIEFRGQVQLAVLESKVTSSLLRDGGGYRLTRVDRQAGAYQYANPAGKVAGYTAQPDAKVALVNEFKADEERLLRKIDEISRKAARAVAENGIEALDVDLEWLFSGKKKLQEGFMALNRAVFQPQRIKLPEDGE